MRGQKREAVRAYRLIRLDFEVSLLADMRGSGGLNSNTEKFGFGFRATFKNSGCKAPPGGT